MADPRIRYVRNEVNVGAELGDRAHVQRFVYELMRGKYFVYLCDDDYWLFPTLLRRQVEAFQVYDNVSFVMGNQLSHFLTTPDSYFGSEPGDAMTFTLDSIGPYFDLATLASRTPHLEFIPKLFSKVFLTSEEYLSEFASDPVTKNRIVGATLYSRDHFIRAGAMKLAGSKWQAGYEFLLGPACLGNVVYLDEPLIVTEIRAANASFQRTQVEHYLDSVKSVEIAFETPLRAPRSSHKATVLKKIKDETIRNLSIAFLMNSLTILKHGSLALCSEENMRHYVTLRHVIPVLVRNRTRPGRPLLLTGRAVTVESVRWLQALRVVRWRVKDAFRLVATASGQILNRVRGMLRVGPKIGPP